MEYIKLKEDGTFDYEVPNYTNTEWDATHFCPAAALTPQEAALFRVVPIIEAPTPAFDSATHKCSRDGAEFTNNEWRYKWTVTALTTAEVAASLRAKQVQALAQINNDDNQIYADVIGNKTTEYTAAELAATTWKTSGYQGAAPEEVQSWADAKGWTARQANDDILYQALTWRGAAALIRRTRLKAKEDVKRVTTIAEIGAAMVIWNGFVASIRTQLGVN